MTLTLDSQLDAALREQARKQGISPEELATEYIRQHVPLKPPDSAAFEEWKQRLRSLATDCGVSLPDEALTSEAMYES